MRNLLQKALGFSMGPVIGAFISLLTIPITTYYISPDEMGKSSMFTVLTSLIIGFIYLGLDQAYVKEYHHAKDKENLLLNAMMIPFIFSIIIAIVSIFFQTNISEYLFGASYYGYLSILFGIQFIFANFERFILLSIRMNERAIEYSIFSITLKIIIFILTIIFILFNKRDFETIVYSTSIGQILGDIILIYRFKSVIQIKHFILDTELIKRMLVFGLPLLVAASLNNMLNTVGRIMLRSYSSFYELGIYTSALRVSGIISIVQQAFTSFWSPVAFRWDKEKRNIKNYDLISRMLLLAMTIFFFLLLFFKKYIILILSSSYSEAQYIVGLLCLMPILYTISETTFLGISFSGKSYLNIWASLFAFIATVIVGYMLIPTYGTLGAAIALAVGYLFYFYSRTVFSRKNGFKVSFKAHFIVSLLMFSAGMINSIRNDSLVLILNCVIFFICILTQVKTIKLLMKVKKHPEDWDFS